MFKGTSNNWFDLDSLTFGGNGVGEPGSGGGGGVAGRTWTVAAQHSGKLMDVSGASTADGAQIVQWAATGGNNQKWQAVDAGGGAVYLKAVHSGKCLAVTGGSTAQGAFLQQSTCNNGNPQKFLATPTDHGGRVHGEEPPQRTVRRRQRRLDGRRRTTPAMELPQRHQPAVAVHRRIARPDGMPGAVARRASLPTNR